MAVAAEEGAPEGGAVAKPPPTMGATGWNAPLSGASVGKTEGGAVAKPPPTMGAAGWDGGGGGLGRGWQ